MFTEYLRIITLESEFRAMIVYDSSRFHVGQIPLCNWKTMLWRLLEFSSRIRFFHLGHAKKAKTYDYKPNRDENEPY
jgi:hypothetical protein